MSEFAEIKKELAEIKELLKKVPQKSDLQGLIEIQQSLIHEHILGVPKPEAPKGYGADSNISKSTKLEITFFTNPDERKQIKITGKATFDYKTLIKASGLSWNQILKEWTGPVENLDKLTASLEGVGLVKGEDFIIQNIIQNIVPPGGGETTVLEAPPPGALKDKKKVQVQVQKECMFD